MSIQRPTFHAVVLAFAMTVALAVAAFASGPAQAAGKTEAQCGHEFDQCQNTCNTEHKDDAGKRAPCVARCSGLYAACDAGVAYDKAKPWLEEQTKKTKRFFDELMKKFDDKKKTPEPPKKDKSNSI